MITAFVILTGISAGLTAAAVAVAAGDLFGEPQSVSVWIGLAVAGVIGTTFLLAAKKWLEGLFNKIIDAPSRKEIKEWIEAVQKQATKHHSELSHEMKMCFAEIYRLRDKVGEDHTELREQVIEIQARHREQDRHDRMRRKADTGETQRP